MPENEWAGLFNKNHFEHRGSTEVGLLFKFIWKCPKRAQKIHWTITEFGVALLLLMQLMASQVYPHQTQWVPIRELQNINAAMTLPAEPQNDAMNTPCGTSEMTMRWILPMEPQKWCCNQRSLWNLRKDITIKAPWWTSEMMQWILPSACTTLWEGLPPLIYH